jgi:hypothetical protein
LACRAKTPPARQYPYYGYYANRVRGARRGRGETAGAADAPPTVAGPVPLPLQKARQRWAELLRQIFEVDPLQLPPQGR